MSSLERKARLIAQTHVKANAGANFDIELKVAFMILEALGVRD